MRWEDIIDGEWRIPVSEREKNTAGALVLPQEALDILYAQPRFASNPYVFAGVGSSYIGSTSYRKAQLDKRAGSSAGRFTTSGERHAPS